MGLAVAVVAAALAVVLVVATGADEPTDRATQRAALSDRSVADRPSDGSDDGEEGEEGEDEGDPTRPDGDAEPDQDGGGAQGSGSGPDTPPEEAAPEITVPIGPVPGDGEVEICAGIVDRLRTYRRVVADNGGPTRLILDSMAEFENEIFTLAENHDWGDRIIERLVHVRREWANSLAAASGGEPEASARAARAALGRLDTAIAEADCPVP